MEFSKYKAEWVLLLIGIACAAVSISFDVISVECTTWFARSGSIIVLVAAIVEYRLSAYLYEDIYQAAIITDRKKATMPPLSENPLVNRIVKSKLTSRPEASRSRKILNSTSHTLVIIGTIVWGYGDLWVC